MNDPLLKRPEESLSPEEERELSARLSEAYCRSEELLSQAEFERVARKIGLLLSKTDTQSGWSET